MAVSVTKIIIYFLVFVIIALSLPHNVSANDILGCGGFIESHVKLDFSKIEVGLYTKSGSLQEKTECAPTNGYFFLPLYEKGDYVLKVHPPPGWSFEPSEVAVSVDGVTDKCSLGKDVNFAFNGYGITGKVITAGQSEGPKGVLIQLVNEQGDTRHTTTAAGGDFHFTPVIPGKYILKASHTKWQVSPSQATLQVKGGNTALPLGALVVKGYDVTGSVTASGHPVPGVHVLLYSKEESPKLRVEGCKTGLLQGVPDAPICYAVSDSAGKFTFGLVPAGDYKLLALSKTPGQATVVYNLKSESVQFTVRHDSQHIENAFEITSYSITGLVSSSLGGPALPHARVFVSGRAAGVTDLAGKYTLTGLTAGDYAVSFVHEQCEIDSIQVSISPSGQVSIGTAVAARWRVCGAVRGGGGERVAVAPGGGVLRVGADGNWCTFLAPGVYTASVELSERDKQNGVQFYPITQSITVSSSPVEGITFSELKARVRGRVVSASGTAAGLAVSLTHTASRQQLKERTGAGGEYEFTEVLPGLVTLSINAPKYCWAEGQISLTVSGAEASAPDFRQVGHRVTLHTDYSCEVEWATEKERGVFTLNPGSSSHCLPKPDQYTLTPRGCHQFNPSSVIVDVTKSVDNIPPFKAHSHASYIRVHSSESVDDLTFSITRGRGTAHIGPVAPRREGDGYVYEHTLYMAEGEVATVTAVSSALVFVGRHPAQLVGSSSCGGGVSVVAARGVTRAGRIEPSVAGVSVTLTSESEDIKQTITTDASGTYSFGPLDASKRYTISASAESYALSAPDEAGVIHARKLAEIIVTLIDDSTGRHLEEALVSVSGGSYRRTAVSGPGAGSGPGPGAGVRFPALAPNDYYVKPHLRDYAFSPTSHLVHVEEGKTHEVTLRGVRVAWRISGRVQSLAGAGVRAHLSATGAGAQVNKHCASSEAQAHTTGDYTLRGLLPGCTYSIDLKPSTEPNAPRYRLAHPPVVIEMKEKKDISGIRLIAIEPHSLTDANVLIYTPNFDHYKTLRLTLYHEDTPNSPLLSTKLDSTGYSTINNPGLMYVMPRLPLDNNTYVVHLESTLSKATHSYDDELVYFTSDGKFKDITIEFLPKLRTSEQELRQTSILVVPLLGLVALAFLYRDRLLTELLNIADNIGSKVSARPAKPSRSETRSEIRSEILDKASIEQIVSNVNAAGKRAPKKRTQLIG